MVDFERAREDANELSGKASDVGRQLGFAGLGLAWVVSGSGGDHGIVRLHDLRLALFVLACGLALDFLQYLWASFFLREFLARHEAELNDGGMDYPPVLRDVGDVLFKAKLLVVAAGYVILLVQVAGHL